MSNVDIVQNWNADKTSLSFRKEAINRGARGECRRIGREGPGVLPVWPNRRGRKPTFGHAF